MTSYKDKLRDPRWQRRRLETLNAHNWQCQECGDTATPLNVHHLAYIANMEPWDHPDALLACLCDRCNAKAHVTTAEPEVIATVAAIAAKMPEYPYCDNCGAIVVNAQGYGHDKRQRKFWCSWCMGEMQQEVQP